jgi:hypothetical protein
MDIIGYTILDEAVVFSNEMNDKTLFIMIYTDDKPEIVFLDRNSLITIPVKKCLRKYKIEKFLQN